MTKIIKRVVVYSLFFTFLLISIFSFSFKLLTGHHKKFTLCDFHQQNDFYPIFFPPPDVYVFVCSFVYLSVFLGGKGYSYYSRTDEQIFVKKLCQEDLAKGRSYYILGKTWIIFWVQKIMYFQKTLAFYMIFL